MQDGKLPYETDRPFTEANGGTTESSFQKARSCSPRATPQTRPLYPRGQGQGHRSSPSRKEAVIAVLDAGHFCGEGCLAGQLVRMASVVAMTDCIATRMEKAVVVRMIHENQEFSERFTTHLLARNIRVEADLVDQLFNSSESVWRASF